MRFQVKQVQYIPIPPCNERFIPSLNFANIFSNCPKLGEDRSLIPIDISKEKKKKNLVGLKKILYHVRGSYIPQQKKHKKK